MVWNGIYLLGHKNKKLFKLDQPTPVIIKLLHHLLHLKEEQHCLDSIIPQPNQRTLFGPSNPRIYSATMVQCISIPRFF